MRLKKELKEGRSLKCPVCKGAGKILVNPCPRCGGNGFIKEKRGEG